MSQGVVEADRSAPPLVRETPPAAARERPRSFGHIPALDGIRGLAVAVVLVFHGGHLDGGFLSVDLFFALSGFLITSLLLVEVSRSGRVDLAQFWLRRAKRLLPALFGLLLGVALFAWLFADPTELRRIRGDAIATLFYFANWHAILDGRGYWDLFTDPSPLEHAWSLAIEEQFYLVWPLVVGGLAWFVHRRARRQEQAKEIAPLLLVVCLVLAIVSPLVMALLFRSGADPSAIYVRTDTRMGGILLGAALACWRWWRGPVQSRVGRVALELAAFAGLTTMLVLWARIDGAASGLYQGGFLLVDVACVTVIAAASHPQPQVVARMFSWRPLMALGIVSYGLYLWHWPVFLVLDSERTGLDGAALFAVRFAVSLAFAIVSYYAIERPIRRSSLRGRTVVVAAPAAAVVCVVALLAATSGARVLPDAGSQFIAASDGVSAQDVRAAARAAEAAGASKTLVLGDSVGVNVGKAAAARAAGTKTAVLAGAIPGCVMTDGVTGYRATSHGRSFVVPDLNECTDRWEQTARDYRPDRVILVYGTGASFLDVERNGRFFDACTTEYRSWYRERLHAVIGMLVENGATEIALLRVPYPTADFLPGTARARIDCVNEVHAQVVGETTNTRLLDLAALICPGGACRTHLDGVAMRSDGLHFDEGAPADYVAQWLLDQTSRPGG